MNIYDISEKAGVSIATVSRVLNNSPHVSEKTRRKVLRIIEQNDYVPNAFARGLGLGSMKTVGLLCPDASDAYLAAAISYLEQDFRRCHYDCLLQCTGRELNARKAGVVSLCGRHVDAMVLMGSSFVEDNDADNQYIRDAAALMPIALLNCAYDCPSVYSVLCDDESAACEATQLLLDSGKRRILYLYHSSNYSGRRKLAGYKAGLASRGVPLDERLLLMAPRDSRGVLDLRDRLLSLAEAGLTFDAVLTSDDILAVSAIKYARTRHLRIPQDLAVIGYNNSGLCLCTEPELTSVDNRLQTLCTHIVQTMLSVLETHQPPQTTIFPANLVRRGST